MDHDHKLIAAALGVVALLLMEEEEEEEEEEQALLNSVSRPRVSYLHGRRDFNLLEWDPEMIHSLTRFTTLEIIKLTSLLQLDGVVYRYRNKPTPESAMCLLLSRLSHPRRWEDLEVIFNRSKGSLSAIYADTLNHLVKRFKPLIRWHPSLTYEKMRKFSHAVNHEARIWGFINNTLKPTCGPEDDQQSCHSGHKKNKTHAIKFHGISTPNGLISSLYGPYEGCSADPATWDITDMETRLMAISADRESLYLYADPTYEGTLCVLNPYPESDNNVLSHDQRAFNETLLSELICAQHTFTLVYNLWNSLPLESLQRPGPRPVNEEFMVAVLLTNLWTCMRRGNQVSKRWAVSPPSAEEYLYPTACRSRERRAV